MIGVEFTNGNPSHNLLLAGSTANLLKFRLQNPFLLGSGSTTFTWRDQKSVCLLRKDDWAAALVREETECTTIRTLYAKTVQIAGHSSFWCPIDLSRLGIAFDHMLLADWVITNMNKQFVRNEGVHVPHISSYQRLRPHFIWLLGLRKGHIKAHFSPWVKTRIENLAEETGRKMVCTRRRWSTIKRNLSRKSSGTLAIFVLLSLSETLCRSSIYCVDEWCGHQFRPLILKTDFRNGSCYSFMSSASAAVSRRIAQ